MNIETIKSKKIQNMEDIYFKIAKVDDLFTNLSSNYSFHCDSSFEESKDIFADLYDKENAFERRINFFKFPQHLFDNEIQKRKEKELEIKRKSRLENRFSRGSKINDFFEKLTHSNKKRLKRKKHLENKKNFASIDDNFNFGDDIQDFSSSKENEFRIEEDDCDGIKKNEMLEDSFQMDFSGIMIKTQNKKRKYKKSESKNEFSSDKFCNDESNNYKKKHKKKKKKKRKKNNYDSKDYSLEDENHLNPNVDQEDILVDEFSNKHKKNINKKNSSYEDERKNKKIRKKDKKCNIIETNNKKSKISDDDSIDFDIDINKHYKNKIKKIDKDKKGKKGKKKKIETDNKDENKFNKIIDSHSKNSNFRFTSSKSQNNNNSRIKRSDIRYDNKSLEESENSKSFSIDLNSSKSSCLNLHRKKIKHKSDSSSDSRTSNSYTSDGDSFNNESSENSSSSSKSYTSNNSNNDYILSENSNFLKEKKIIENKIMKEYEVNPNDNTVERENKLEKLQQFNNKIDQIKQIKTEKVKKKEKLPENKKYKNTDENKNPKKIEKFKNEDESENINKSQRAKKKKHNRERISNKEIESSDNSLIEENLKARQEKQVTKHKKKVYERRKSSENESKSEKELNYKKNNNNKKISSKKEIIKNGKMQKNEKSKYDGSNEANKNKNVNYKSEKNIKQKNKREKKSSSSSSLTSIDSSEKSIKNYTNSSLKKREKSKLNNNKLKKSQLFQKTKIEEVNPKRQRNKKYSENEKNFIKYSKLKESDKNSRKNNLNDLSSNMNRMYENSEVLTESEDKNNSHNKDKNIKKKKDEKLINFDNNCDHGKNTKFSQKFLINSKKNSSKDKGSNLNKIVNKALSEIKEIKKHKRILEREDNEENSFSTLQTPRAINLNNKNTINKNKNLFNSKNNLFEENKSNQNYFAYLKGREKRSKYEKEDYFQPLKKRKKEFETIIDDGSAIQKLKLLKRQITLQKKKEISNQKLLIFAKKLLKKSLNTLENGGILESIIKPKTDSNIQNGIEPILMFNKHLKDSKSISLKFPSRKISEFNFSKDSKNEDINENNNIDLNNSINNKSFASPVASIIKNPIKIKDEVIKIFQSIKLIKDEKQYLRENLEEEKSKIEKNNLINLLIEKCTNSNYTKNINNSSLNNGIAYDESSKNIPVPLKYNIPKFSNDHILLNKIKNNYFEEFKKKKYNLETIRNINTKISNKRNLENISNLNFNDNKLKSKGRRSNINSKNSKLIINNIDHESESNEMETNVDNSKNSKVIIKEKDTINHEENEMKQTKNCIIKKESKIELDQQIRQEEENCFSKNKDNYNVSKSKKSEDGENIGNNLKFDNQNNNKDYNRNELNKEDLEISKNNSKNNQNNNYDSFKRRNDVIKTLEKLENLNVSVKKDAMNHLDEVKIKKEFERLPEMNSNEDLNLHNEILPKVIQEKLPNKQITLKETPKENKKNPFKFFNNDLKFLTKEIIKSLKISQKLLKDKIENQENILSLKSIDKYFNTNLLKQTSSEIKNSNIQSPAEEENQKIKDSTLKERFKILNEHKKQNFQHLIKLNMQKIQDKIRFDFDSENGDSDLITQNFKSNDNNNYKFVPEINNNIIKGDVNNNRRNSKKIYKLDSLKLKSNQEIAEQKPISPLSPLIESKKIGIIKHSATVVNDSNFIEIIRTKEKNFSPLFENALSNNNASENTSKNYFFGKTNSENIFQLSSNINIKSDNNNFGLIKKENTINKICLKRSIKSLITNKKQFNSIDSNKDLVIIEKNKLLPLNLPQKKQMMIKVRTTNKNIKQNFLNGNEEKANADNNQEINKKANILSKKTSDLSIAGIKKNIINNNRILEIKLPQIK